MKDLISSWNPYEVSLKVSFEGSSNIVIFSKTKLLQIFMLINCLLKDGSIINVC